MATHPSTPTACDCCARVIPAGDVDSVWIVPGRAGAAVACGAWCARALKPAQDMLASNHGASAAKWQDVARDYASLARGTCEAVSVMPDLGSAVQLAVAYQRCAAFAHAEACLAAGLDPGR